MSVHSWFITITHRVCSITATYLSGIGNNLVQMFHLDNVWRLRPRLISQRSRSQTGVKGKKWNVMHQWILESLGTKCSSWQDNVSYKKPRFESKGQGHKLRSKVKKGDPLLCSGYNSIMHGWVLKYLWHNCSFWQEYDSLQKLNVTIWG